MRKGARHHKKLTILQARKDLANAKDQLSSTVNTKATIWNLRPKECWLASWRTSQKYTKVTYWYIPHGQQNSSAETDMQHTVHSISHNKAPSQQTTIMPAFPRIPSTETELKYFRLMAGIRHWDLKPMLSRHSRPPSTSCHCLLPQWPFVQLSSPGTGK